MQNLVKALVKKLARTLLGDYSAYHIYSWPAGDVPASMPGTTAAFTVRSIDESEIESSGEPLIREQAGYAGADSHAYACFDADRIVAICFYWFGDRYRKRNFWPLGDGEVKLVQIIALPDVRGRGAATLLLASSCRDILQKGFCRAYARIWHSNTPSLRAFERAGWARAALVLEINPLRRRRPIRIRVDSKWRRRGTMSAARSGELGAGTPK